MLRRVAGKNEKGTTVAEIAMVALLFFTLIFGIIEFGRLLYTHNALTDAARRAARYAVLNAKNDVCVKNVAVYGDTHIDVRPDCDPTGPELINGLSTATVSPCNANDPCITTQYEGFDHDGNPATDAVYGSNLGRVTVTITNYKFNLSIPIIGRQITMPDYLTTLEAECAGEKPGNVAPPGP